MTCHAYLTLDVFDAGEHKFVVFNLLRGVYQNFLEILLYGLNLDLFVLPTIKMNESDNSYQVPATFQALAVLLRVNWLVVCSICLRRSGSSIFLGAISSLSFDCGNWSLLF